MNNIDINLEKSIENGELIFLAYVGFITQPLISAIVDYLEQLNEKKDYINLPQRLYVVFIEIAQNMMNYAKDDEYKAFILIAKEENGYYILSKNSVTLESKNKLEKILNEIINMDKEEIKKLYKQRRRSGEKSHGNSAGIGFLEIAKRSKKIEYNFASFKDDKYIFSLKVYV